MEADYDSVGEGVIGVTFDPLPKQRGQRPPRYLRKRRTLMQHAFSEWVGVHVTQLRRYESARLNPPWR